MDIDIRGVLLTHKVNNERLSLSPMNFRFIEDDETLSKLNQILYKWIEL